MRLQRLGSAACWGLIAILLPAAAPAQAVNYVKSVQYSEIGLEHTETTKSVNLGLGQTFTNCVPFASLMKLQPAADSERLNRFFTDVYVESGPNRVTIQRDNSRRNRRRGIYVVEFGPAYVKVQARAAI